MKKSYRLTLVVILISSTLSVMAGAIIAPVLNLIRDALNISIGEVGLIITTHALFVAIFSPLFGNVIDRIGPKIPYVFGLFLYGLGGAAGVFISSFYLLLVSRVLLGIGIASFFNAITVTILNLFQGEHRDIVMGWRTSAISIGGIIWPIIGGFLGDFSYHLPFAVYSVGIILAILTWIAIPATPGGKTKDKEHKGSILLVLKKSPKLIAIYGFMFFMAISLFSIIIFLPLLLTQIKITSPLIISFYLSEMMFFTAIVSLSYSKIKKRISYKTIILIALFLWTIGFLIIYLAFSALTSAISLALFGVGLGIVLPAMMIWAGELASFSFRGRVLAYLGALIFLGQFLSPIILTPVSRFLGLKGVFLVTGAASAILFFVFLFSLRKTQ